MIEKYNEDRFIKKDERIKDDNKKQTMCGVSVIVCSVGCGRNRGTKKQMEGKRMNELKL